MTWYYLPCGSCNKNGSFSKVNPNCSRCSGTGNDWDEGEDGRKRLRSIYGKEPQSGKPPSHNMAGESVYSGGTSGTVSGHHTPSKQKSARKTFGIILAIALFAAGLHMNGQLSEGGAKILIAIAMGVFFLRH